MMIDNHRSPGASDCNVASGNARTWQADKSSKYSFPSRWRQILLGFPIGAKVLVRHFGIGTVVAGTRSSYLIRIDRPSPGQPVRGINVLVTDLTAIERLPSNALDGAAQQVQP